MTEKDFEEGQNTQKASQGKIEANKALEEATMAPEAFRKVIRPVEEEMKSYYLDYAMSVIIGRALPDVRDGLKPVHRRIIYSMNLQGMQHNKAYKKCARIVGDVLGRYHPHGDSSVYDALVRMAQNFSLRYPLIDGHGNFGSVDGDSAAAMRYTEARMAKISEELVSDIDKETVDFMDNFDGTLQEPTVLPSKLPTLLVNGTSGIAVGMATSIPPHNITEICKATISLIDNPELETKALMETVKGPDFPTGGIITGTSGIQRAYATGHGKVLVKSKIHEETVRNRNCLIVTEIPYMVNKAMLVEEIANQVNNKNIMGIADIRDESDRTGMRVVIVLKREANKDVVLNQLYKFTRLKTTIGMNLLALVDNAPKVMNLREIIGHFISHRRSVVVRRTKYDLRKAREKEHILQGLVIALDYLDSVIKLIRGSKSASEASQGLMENYGLSERQAKAILEMRLQRLTNMEQNKVRDDLKETQKLIGELESILASNEKINQLIKDELNEIINNYGNKRKTEITFEDEDDDIEIEDLIEKEDVVVTISHSGYIKRTPLKTYRAQKRGGKGIIGATTSKENDVVEHLFIANTHDYILFFTDDGQVHWLKVWKIPESGRYSAGKAIVNLLQLSKGRTIAAFVKIDKFDEKQYLLMATKNGLVKKTSLKAYSRPRAGGIKGILIEPGDKLINVIKTDGTKHILLASRDGMAVKFDENNVRSMGRVSRGVKGINLRKGDEVVGMVSAEEDKTLLTITENGYGKRTNIDDYRLVSRGSIGVKNIVCSQRNGKVVAVKSVSPDDEIMFISSKGIMIRTTVEGISVIGRNTLGMRLMKLASDDNVVAAARIASNNDTEKENS
ncbi:MAG: DNA gyrase subunit A [Nanoarchaeota archaeon]